MFSVTRPQRFSLRASLPDASACACKLRSISASEATAVTLPTRVLEPRKDSLRVVEGSACVLMAVHGLAAHVKKQVKKGSLVVNMRQHRCAEY